MDHHSVGGHAIVRTFVMDTNLMQIYLVSSYPETAEAALFTDDPDVETKPGGAMQLATVVLESEIGVFLILLLITAVVFLVWPRRMRINLPALGARTG